MFKRILTGLVFTLTATSAYSQSLGRLGTIGTKFACCAIHNNSTLGGGSCTTYNRSLRDRALTQVDAQIRCGTQKLVWGSHECPAPAGDCSSAPAQKTCPGYITFKNATNTAISFDLLSANSWTTVSLAPNETRAIYAHAKPSSSGDCSGAYTQVSHDWLYEAGTQQTLSSVFIGGTATFDYWREGQLGWNDTDPNKRIIGTRVRN
jgi:hypothetical protein